MTNRIKSASVAVFADDTQLDRLQAFGVSSRLNSEDVREIGNLDIVEVVDDIPQVEITADSNQYGSVKTLAKFAGKNYNWSTVVVTLATSGSVAVSSGYYFINEMLYTKAAASTHTITAPASANQKRIDTISIATNGTVTVTAGTPTTGTPVAPATPAGNLKLAEVQSNANASAEAVPMTYLNILNCHDEVSLALKDFEFASVDFVVPVKEQGDNTDVTYGITRSMYVADAFVNRYDAAFSVNGAATENYSLESDNKTWFLNAAGTIYVDRFKGNGTTSGFTLTCTPTTRDNGNDLIKCYKYNSTTGVYTTLVEGTDFTVTAKALELSAAPLAAETVVARYGTNDCPLSGQPFFKRVPDEVDPHPVIAGGLRHGQVEVYLSDDTANHVLRLQSVTISSSLTRDALYEIGHKRAYDRPLQFPIPITVQVEALASDLREFARLCGKNFSTANELSIDQFLKNLDLTVKVYREDDVVRSTAPEVQSKPLKTITITNVSLTDENFEIRTEGNGTSSFGLKANSNLTVAGII